jgi:PPOX class probable FMN-dependent enzyme
MAYEITTEDDLRKLMGDPVHPLVVVKSTPVITEPLGRYIERSPFACLATYGADGTCDLSPRGDPPGFIRVLDEKTLFLPERPGNRRLDCIINIIQQPQLSLLFMIPGTLETVRVNGTGVVTTDPELLALSPVNNKLPEIGVLITVGEALGHCSKAFRRSKLWQDDYIADDGVPTLAEMMTGHLEIDETLSNELDEGIEIDVRDRMY